MAAELQLDLTVMRRNAERMQAEIASLGKQWRPHVKSHCQPKIAAMLMQLGACGVTAANVAEVEVMTAAEIPSILLAHLAVADRDLKRLAEASRQTELLLTVDHYVQAERYSSAAKDAGVTFPVLIDVDIGMNRTGTRPRIEAATLAKATQQLPGLTVTGIMGYEGHLLTIDDADAKHVAIVEAMNVLQQTRDAVISEGLNCDIVSAGGSGSFWITGQHAAVTEIQAGGGIFGDLFYQQSCGLKDVDIALTVVADVVSRPSLDQAVLNCGRKAINPIVCPPEVVGVPGAAVGSLSAEHTVLHLEGSGRDLKIGDRVRLAVGYSDHSILMHREIQIYEADRYVETWPVVRPS